MTTIHRIKLIAEKESITLTALEKKIGASKGVLTRAYNNKTDIQCKWLALIVENYPLYNSNWILTGTGGMIFENESNSINTCTSCLEKDIQIKDLKETITDLREDKKHLKGEITILREQLQQSLPNDKSKRHSA